jgi:lysozyme
MSPTADCIALVKSFEGCKLEAYADSVGIPTIGYGRTQGVKLGDTCTQEQADAWLAEDLQSAADAVLRLVKVNLSQGEYGALVSFTYNLGQANLARSTLLRLLNQGDKSCAAEFPKWSFAGGKLLNGLLRRRLAEQALFMKG